VGVFLRFRQEPIAIMSDLKQMFHQVKVDPKDIDAFRFLWWPNGDLTKGPDDYQMLVHLFGATSSHSCASYALKKTAVDYEVEFDVGTVNTLNRNFYVDDCLKSLSSIEKALKIVEGLPKLLKRGGFNPTKWTFTLRELIDVIPEEERAPTIANLDLEKLPMNRALGVRWNVEKDTFGFKVTRRDVLDTCPQYMIL